MQFAVRGIGASDLAALEWVPPLELASREPVSVDLALRGSGPQGAFTWGVLDRLLELSLLEKAWLRIEAISGASMGAMNAAVLVDGWTRGGAKGARTALDTFWQRISSTTARQNSPLDRLMGRRAFDASRGRVVRDPMARVLSPCNLNPLRAVLDEIIDFDRLAHAPIKLFVTATNVRTGRSRIFRNGEITADVLLASACLPTMFQVVEIDGEAYWDGGYADSPTIAPLVRESSAQDTILVQINPNGESDTLRAANEIVNRFDEASFDSPLTKELRMIALLRQVGNLGHGEKRWADRRTHSIKNDGLTALGNFSKFNTEWKCIKRLKEAGHKSADKFLARHGDDLGKRSTVDLDILLEKC